MLPLDGELLTAAGALTEPALRTLDAIHVAVAAALAPVDAFVSYDDRQCAAGRLAGLRTVAPAVEGGHRDRRSRRRLPAAASALTELAGQQAEDDRVAPSALEREVGTHRPGAYARLVAAQSRTGS